jgi:diadenosine tetraphosphate (Ap4A) HIT family hydrolase
MTCCLCPNRVSSDSPEFWNKPLFETANFAVIPSLGSIVQGWLMLVPKAHVVCAGELSDALANEMRCLTGEISALVSSSFGEVCVFEHGPSTSRKSTGCGVDHAHLHIVPVDFDLAAAALRFMPNNSMWVAGDWHDCRNAYLQGLDYLYIEQPIGCGRIATHAEFASQVFRKAIAQHTGIPEQFSWRDFPRPEVAASTIRVLFQFAKASQLP